MELKMNLFVYIEIMGKRDQNKQKGMKQRNSYITRLFWKYKIVIKMKLLRTSKLLTRFVSLSHSLNII